MLPFRSHPPTPQLREGYNLVADPFPSAEALNRLLVLGGDQPRDISRWQRVLERSIWHLGVERLDGELVGFIRMTSDMALNANLWDLCWDPADPARDEVLASLVYYALARLRRELSGCSISLSAPPAAIRALERYGFVVDPGGIRAMGLKLR